MNYFEVIWIDTRMGMRKETGFIHTHSQEYGSSVVMLEETKRGSIYIINAFEIRLTACVF